MSAEGKRIEAVDCFVNHTAIAGGWMIKAVVIKGQQGYNVSNCNK